MSNVLWQCPYQFPTSSAKGLVLNWMWGWCWPLDVGCGQCLASSFLDGPPTIPYPVCLCVTLLVVVASSNKDSPRMLLVWCTVGLSHTLYSIHSIHSIDPFYTTGSSHAVPSLSWWLQVRGSIGFLAQGFCRLLVIEWGSPCPGCLGMFQVSVFFQW